MEYAASLYGSPTRTIKNISEYFKECLTWPYISTSSRFGVKYQPTGYIFDVAGSSLFTSAEYRLYLCGLLCSKVSVLFMRIINPTMNFQSGDVSRIPVIYSNKKENKIKKIVNDNINISHYNWNSFETSWDFKKHPLIKFIQSNALQDESKINEKQKLNDNGSIELSFNKWENFTTVQFTQLKANEEELNRIFIDIYGLQDELTPEVEDKDVTIPKADLDRDIRSFLSYAVGCILGRYSLDVEKLAYSGGEWEDDKYTTIIPEQDNIIPITDEEYFDDDMVVHLINFVKVVYGVDSLEENLDFIAKALGNRGNTSREIIRNYFLKDFYKDHVKIYQKRPIYWLFDSGKENGFKALIYMHRYDEDTVGRIRTDYLHKIQRKLEDLLNHCNMILNSDAPAGEKAIALKKKETLIKQLAENQTYDQAIAHIALKRIPIDLDDGVKVNYAKFQNVEVASEGKKAVKVNLLAKI